jgi:hypothetical protein
MNALTFIDKLLGCRCRDGPDRGLTYALISQDDIQSLKTGLLSCNMRLVDPCYLPKLQLWSLGNQVIPHALKLSRAYYEVILDSYPKFLEFSLVEQLEAFRSMASWNLEDFIKNAKFFTAMPMARFLKNPLPERPSTFPTTLHVSLFSGAIKRFFKNRMIAFNRKNLSFFLGLLQGVKRGAETVPDSFVYEAMLKHKAILTKEYDPISQTTWSERVDMSKLFQRFFKKFRPVAPRLYEASTAAGYSSLRGEGGARDFLRKVHNYSSEIDVEDSNLLDMYEARPGDVREIKGEPTWENFNSLMTDLSLMTRFTPEALHNNVQVSAVCEPLKVRLITKGNEFKYYLSRFYQKAMWQYLQRYPQFVATGRPIRLDDFYNLLDREDLVFQKTDPKSPFQRLNDQGEIIRFDKWVSGDYSAATDNLKISYTKDAFETSLNRSGLNDTVKDLLRDVLYEQEIHYPKKFESKGGLEPKMQTNGQLMGSTLSFPILCIVNLCAYWKTLEEYLNREIALYDLPVLINGDDILFRCNDAFYNLWMQNITEVGFILSLGKNYVHQTFFTINSLGFLFNREKREISEIGFLNVGLLTGQSKLNKRKKELLPAYAIYNEVMKGAQNKLRAHQRFLHYQKDDVKYCTKEGEFSLFISPLLGGCGFDLYDEVKPHVYFTGFQTKLASYIYETVILQPHEENYEPFKALSFRTPALQDSIININVKRKLYHHGVYRFIPLTQPNLEDQIDLKFSQTSNFKNVGTIDTESQPLKIRSFPIKTILSFREELKNRGKVFYHKKMNPLFLDLQVKLVEEKYSVKSTYKLPEVSFSMDEYMN